MGNMKGKMIYLSHPLSGSTPGYGGTHEVVIRREKEIRQGASCNMQRWDFSNHSGTHLDAPRHFFDEGMTVDAFPPDYWVCGKVGVLFLPLQESRWIGPEDMGTALDPAIECLLIKTGFQRHRETASYGTGNPGLSAELALMLRRSYPRLKFVGMDFISVSRFRDREGGRAAHRAFLNPASPIMPIEDMNLAPLQPETKISRLSIVPLRVENADGAPVTVIAELL